MTVAVAAPTETTERQEPVAEAQSTKVLPLEKAVPLEKVVPLETKPAKAAKKKEVKERVVAERGKPRDQRKQELAEKYLEEEEEEDEPVRTTVLEREAPRPALFGLFRF